LEFFQRSVENSFQRIEPFYEGFRGWLYISTGDCEREQDFDDLVVSKTIETRFEKAFSKALSMPMGVCGFGFHRSSS
jgi:hypothetical protein